MLGVDKPFTANGESASECAEARNLGCARPDGIRCASVSALSPHLVRLGVTRFAPRRGRIGRFAQRLLGSGRRQRCLSRLVVPGDETGDGWVGSIRGANGLQPTR